MPHNTEPNVEEESQEEDQESESTFKKQINLSYAIKVEPNPDLKTSFAPRDNINRRKSTKIVRFSLEPNEEER